MTLLMLYQIDSSKPSSNSTVVESLLHNGTLAIQVDKFDTGSGVGKIDVYQLTGMLLVFTSGVYHVLYF